MTVLPIELTAHYDEITTAKSATQFSLGVIVQFTIQNRQAAVSVVPASSLLGPRILKVCLLRDVQSPLTWCFVEP